MTMIETNLTTQVYRVYIKASPEAIWDAITQPQWTDRYGYGGAAEYEMKAGGSFRHLSSAGMRAMGIGDLAVDGQVIECDPPRKLVQTWRMVMDPEIAAEGFTRLTYEIGEPKDGVTKLTVVHDLEGAPKLALLVSGSMEETGAGGGWAWVLSGLKTVLETGHSLSDPPAPG
jgi:uncharacterized protein YndB with AHSA1/START domain